VLSSTVSSYFTKKILHTVLHLVYTVKRRTVQLMSIGAVVRVVRDCLLPWAPTNEDGAGPTDVLRSKLTICTYSVRET
jgi:hypothetical protein